MASNNIVQATGKRKTCIARAYIKKGSGLFLINNQDYKTYINNEMLILKVCEPLTLSDSLGKFDIKINVFGGGQSSQIDAIRQAIAKALIEITGSEELRKTFIEYDRSMVIADTRFKEMKKPNNSHARAKRQKSYR